MPKIVSVHLRHGSVREQRWRELIDTKRQTHRGWQIGCAMANNWTVGKEKHTKKTYIASIQALCWHSCRLPCYNIIDSNAMTDTQTCTQWFFFFVCPFTPANSNGISQQHAGSALTHLPAFPNGQSPNLCICVCAHVQLWIVHQCVSLTATGGKKSQLVSWATG